MSSVSFLLATLLGGMFVTAVISAVESSLLGTTAGRMRAAAERGERGVAQLQYWLDHTGQTLATLNLIRLCCVLAVAGSAWQLTAYLPWYVPPVLAELVLAGPMLVVSYMLPRTWAKGRALWIARHTIWLVRWLTMVLSPLIWPLSMVVRGLARIFGDSGTLNRAFWTPEEFRRLSSDARTDALEKHNEELISSIIEFSDTTIREIMVPRTEMIAVPTTSTALEVQQVVVEAGHSRIPVYEETVDNIVGVLHVKDLFEVFFSAPQGANGGAPGKAFNPQTLARPIFYVPEVMKASDLLKEFQRRKTHMAIVVDEYGGTAGVVTLEDIIEVIVGEIQDEYDIEEKQFRVMADGKIIADGRVSIWDLEEPLGVEFPEDAAYETLAGFLMHRAGYLPRPGTVMTWGGFRFTIKEANERRVGMVEIERLAHTDDRSRGAGAH